MQRIHLKAPANWINDPNGFIYYKGKYHLFYQHFPYEPRWGTMHWGHAVSDDLVTWEHKGIALFPYKYDDQNGCFSGSAVEDHGHMYLFYTGVRYLETSPEDIHVSLNEQYVSAQMMLSSEDGMDFDNRRKITVIPPREDPDAGCRDPKVWRGKDAWYMILGSKTADDRGKVLFYRSDDLKNWSYINSASKENMGWMWECPDYFEVSGKQVLVLSPMGLLKDGLQPEHITICTTVDFEETACVMKIPDHYQFFDYGLDLYAPQSTTDAGGRRVIIAWARMPEAVDGKWNGMFCIPRVVQVKNGHIYFSPHPNIISQFTRRLSAADGIGRGNYRIRLAIKEGEKLDIGGYLILCSQNKICTDRSRVFRGNHEIRRRFCTPDIGGCAMLDIYVEPNLIEIYVNDGEYVISNVVYGLDDHIASDGEIEIYTVE